MTSPLSLPQPSGPPPAAAAAERGWWWPVATASMPASAAPTALRLLAEPLVLWFDAAGAPVLQRDQCPHRGARLSMGSVCDGQLQCPYHGWRFDASGACVRVPALPAFVPPASSSVPTFPVREAHGLWWTTFGDPAAARLPSLPELLPSRRLVLGPFDVATSAPRAVENFLDTAHFATVHAGWLGEAAYPEVPHHDITLAPDDRPIVEHYRAWQPRATASSHEGAWVAYRYEVLSPYSALLTKQGESGTGPQDNYVIWACPLEPESCRLWFAQYTSDVTSSDEQLMDFQMAIFAQDQPVLESQVPKRLPVSATAPREASTAADRLSAAYRRYLRQQGISFGVC
jgi:phenylpropionate dioxygenase-like ring-hydroxylating dioxygenase large terminal subunit